MNLLDKEKAITLICEYIKSKQNIESITKVISNFFCFNIFDNHTSFNEFGNYYIIKNTFSNNSTKLNKEIINRSYLSFKHENVDYKLHVVFSSDENTTQNRSLDIKFKRFGFSASKTIHYQVLIPKKQYILDIGHYSFDIEEEEYDFIMKTYDTVIELHNNEKEINRLSNIEKDNNTKIAQLLKQFNI